MKTIVRHIGQDAYMVGDAVVHAKRIDAHSIKDADTADALMQVLADFSVHVDHNADRIIAREKFATIAKNWATKRADSIRIRVLETKLRRMERRLETRNVMLRRVIEATSHYRDEVPPELYRLTERYRKTVDSLEPLDTDLEMEKAG